MKIQMIYILLTMIAMYEQQLRTLALKAQIKYMRDQRLYANDVLKKRTEFLLEYTDENKQLSDNRKMFNKFNF